MKLGSEVWRSSTTVLICRRRRASRMWLPTKPLAPVRRTFNRRPSQQPQLLADFAQLLQGKVNLGVSVCGHQADADQLMPGRHRRRDDRVDKHALFFEALGHLEGGDQVAAI